ncbi:MAG: Crp/Fnr family transcriptional regulator [Aquificaceae bacterium]|nr:MAG: Crp/Fnr family transcriptional regulator [Aquificaceae bacterium]
MPNITGKGHCLTCPIRYRSIFSGLSEEILKTDIKDFHTSILECKSNDVIYQQGEPSKYAYTLREGLIKLTKSLPNGRTQIVRILKKGDLFGFDGFADKAYNHTAITVSKSEICRLPLKDLDQLRIKNIEINSAMMARWLKNIREAEDMMLELGAKKAPEKLASFLLKWCEGLDEKDWIKLELSRREIGDFLGLTIETVSRFLSEWKRLGFLEESKGFISIVNSEGLRKKACSTVS